MSTKPQQETADETEERVALERIATGYHDNDDDIRRLAAEQLIARYGYESDDFEDLELDP